VTTAVPGRWNSCTCCPFVLLRWTPFLESLAAACSVLVLVGSLSFDILSRLTGDWSVIDRDSASEAISWANAFAEPLVFDTPFLWFGFNLVLWLVLAYGSMRLLKHMAYLAKGALVLRIKCFAKLNMTKWNRYLRTKTTAVEDRNYESINHVVKLDWFETDVKRTCVGEFPVGVHAACESQRFPCCRRLGWPWTSCHRGI
jgi:hypothetical protein